MKFKYKPVRDDKKRVDYYFELSRGRIRAVIRHGEEIYSREKGRYVSNFNSCCCEVKFFYLNSKFFYNDSLYYYIRRDDVGVEGRNSVCFHLLKPHCEDVMDNLSVTYSDWNEVLEDSKEGDLELKTSLAEFDIFIHRWNRRLNEIVYQTHNLFCLLKAEYSRINSREPPFASPITVRTFKTAVLQNVVLYIEATANFLSELALHIDSCVDGAPRKRAVLKKSDICTLKEEKRFISLEDKLRLAPECIGTLLSSECYIDRGGRRWSDFKKIKSKRDHLTHIKSRSTSLGDSPSLDSMLAAVELTDMDLFASVEVLCWINFHLESIMSLVGGDACFRGHRYNGFILSKIVVLSSEIAEVDGGPTLAEFFD